MGRVSTNAAESMPGIGDVQGVGVCNYVPTRLCVLHERSSPSIHYFSKRRGGATKQTIGISVASMKLGITGGAVAPSKK